MCNNLSIRYLRFHKKNHPIYGQLSVLTFDILDSRCIPKLIFF